MKKTVFFMAILSVGVFAACTNSESENTGVTDISESTDDAEKAEPEEVIIPDTYERGGLKIYPKPESVKFENARLTTNKPVENATFEAGEVNFDFTVENYELGQVTTDAEGNGLANSGKGQHIHLIVDNGPYSAHYEPKFAKSFEAGNHVAIAFLSRSYHESVKNGNAFKVFQFTTGKEGEGNTEKMDLTKPMLFYSRPKGEYSGADTKKILFDFYLHNVSLGNSDHKLKLTINGEEEFIFAKWQPYIVEGLPMGENTFTIELTDVDGNPLSGKMHKVTRKFTLAE